MRRYGKNRRNSSNMQLSQTLCFRATPAEQRFENGTAAATEHLLLQDGIQQLYDIAAYRMLCICVLRNSKLCFPPSTPIGPDVCKQFRTGDAPTCLSIPPHPTQRVRSRHAEHGETHKQTSTHQTDRDLDYIDPICAVMI